MVKALGDGGLKINLLEELSMNAWPSLQTVWYDGWVLRFAEAYTRRANSVNIVHPSRVDIAEKISYCEEVYASRDLDTMFRMTPVFRQEVPDSVLENLGYTSEGLSSVMVKALDDSQGQISENVHIDDRPTDEWLAAYCRLSALDTDKTPVMARLLDNIVPASAFFSLRLDMQIVAVGLAVVERGYVGLFNIVVAGHSRNQGVGTLLVSNMLRWGKANDAYCSYLAAMRSNTPAMRLYGKLGFREAYSYWYRVKRLHGASL